MSDADTHSRHRTTLTMPADLNARIEAELDYGDEKAAWIRQAIRERLRRDASTE